MKGICHTLPDCWVSLGTIVSQACDLHGCEINAALSSKLVFSWAKRGFCHGVESTLRLTDTHVSKTLLSSDQSCP